MRDVLEIAGRIHRGRTNSRYIEIRIQCDDASYRFELRRDDPVALRILANLLTRFPDRDSVFGYELDGLDVRGEAWLEQDGELGDLAWLEPAAAAALPEAGPNAMSRASVVFFNRPYRRTLGRRPSVMRVGDGDVCEECGAAAREGHHVEPRVWGGEDDAANRRKLCDGCHDKISFGAGVPRLRPGWREVEVIKVKDSRARVEIVRGDPRGRQYWVCWSSELGYAPSCGRVYDAFLDWDGVALVVKYVEPVFVVRPEGRATRA